MHLSVHLLSMRSQRQQQVFRSTCIALVVVVHHFIAVYCVSGMRCTASSRWCLQYNHHHHHHHHPTTLAALLCNPRLPLQVRNKRQSPYQHSTTPTTVRFLAQQQSLEFSNDNKNGQRKVLPEAFEYTIRQDAAQDDNDDNDGQTEVEEEDVDPLRWERLYQQGAAQSSSSSKQATIMNSFTTNKSSESAVVSQVRVVSFDLDNTLWDTMATIDAANEALAEFLDQHNVVQPERVETIMGTFFRANKARYCPELQQEEKESDSSSTSHNNKAPVLLTLLRKDVLQHILQEHNGYSLESAREMVDRAFSTWINARYKAIDASLAKDVPQTLKEIIQDLKQQQQPATTTTTRSSGNNNSNNNSQHQQLVVVGAITDGNANPRKVQQLAPFFDFVINAEQVGVAKPNRQVYLQAVRHVLKCHPHVFSLSNHQMDKDAMLEEPESAAGAVAAASSTLSDDDIAKLIGPWWVHVGDDFVKDVVAAKTLNMRSIWSRELVGEKNKTNKKNGTSSTQSSSPTVKDDNNDTPDQDKQQVQEQPQSTLPPSLLKQEDDSPSSILQQPKDDDGSRPNKFVMQVGSTDYLATSLQEEFADAIVDRFVDVRTVLLDWHLEGIIQQSNNENDDVNDNEDVSTTRKPPHTNINNNPSASSSAATQPIVRDETLATSTKFCIFCGEKLPLIANFCSACGQKQQQQ